MKPYIKTIITIFTLLIAHLLLFATDKPLLVIDIKTQGTYEDLFNYLQKLKKPSNEVRVQFTNDNDILISYIRHEILDNQKTKNVEKLRTSTFVVLLLRGETGELIKRIEWPVNVAFLSTNNIYTLPEGGYLSISDNHLQALDSSLNIIHSKLLNLMPQNQKYNIVTPSKGYFFIVEQWGREKNFEIIDWRTFETIEIMSASDISIKGIWNDRLLAIGLSGGNYTRLLEKKIGDASFTSFGHDLLRLQDAKFMYNGAVVVTCRMEHSVFGPSFWFVMEDGKRSEPVIYGKNNKERMGSILPAGRSPIIAVAAYKISRMRDFLDIDIAGAVWTDYWDTTTQQRLLRSKREKDVLAGAFSPDGRSLVLLKKKKLEMYAIPPTPEKKK